VVEFEKMNSLSETGAESAVVRNVAEMEVNILANRIGELNEWYHWARKHPINPNVDWTMTQIYTLHLSQFLLWDPGETLMFTQIQTPEFDDLLRTCEDLNTFIRGVLSLRYRLIMVSKCDPTKGQKDNLYGSLPGRKSRDRMEILVSLANQGNMQTKKICKLSTYMLLSSITVMRFP
jgi:hypothetical protein